MSKKSKRQVRKAPAVAPAPVVVAAPTLAQPAGPARLTSVAEFNPDYTYVVERSAPHRHPGARFRHRPRHPVLLYIITRCRRLRGGFIFLY